MSTHGRTALAAALAAFAILGAEGAGAEEMFRETRGVSCPPNGGGCAQFQGYIYVRRDRETAPAPIWRPARGGDSRLDGRRLYLNLGAAESR